MQSPIPWYPVLQCLPVAKALQWLYTQSATCCILALSQHTGNHRTHYMTMTFSCYLSCFTKPLAASTGFQVSQVLCIHRLHELSHSSIVPIKKKQTSINALTEAANSMFCSFSLLPKMKKLQRLLKCDCNFFFFFLVSQYFISRIWQNGE